MLQAKGATSGSRPDGRTGREQGDQVPTDRSEDRPAAT